MALRKRPLYTMSVAAQGQTGSLAEMPLDLSVDDLRGQSYLALRAGDVVVLLTECEAKALASAVRTLSVLATAPDSARDHIGKAAPGEHP